MLKKAFRLQTKLKQIYHLYTIQFNSMFIWLKHIHVYNVYRQYIWYSGGTRQNTKSNFTGWPRDLIMNDCDDTVVIIEIYDSEMYIYNLYIYKS
jgi:hypothetical protein